VQVPEVGERHRRLVQQTPAVAREPEAVPLRRLQRLVAAVVMPGRPARGCAALRSPSGLTRKRRHTTRDEEHLQSTNACRVLPAQMASAACSAAPTALRAYFIEVLVTTLEPHPHPAPTAMKKLRIVMLGFSSFVIENGY
jgi:hypothetical protein